VRKAPPGPRSPKRDRAFRDPKGALWVASALAVKGIVLYQLGSHPLLQPHGDLDTAEYVELARQIAAGGPLAVHQPFFLSPLYVYFLATIFSAGGGLLAARLVQIFLGSAAVGIVYLLARDWFGARQAHVAAMLALLTGFVTFSEILILQSALDPVLVAAALYFVARTQVGHKRWPAVTAGIALGLFALNRPNGIAYALAAPALIALASSRNRQARARAWPAEAGVVLACVIAVLGANALRNYRASGEWILISSHGGLNFYIGNNPEATGTYRPVPDVAASVAGQVRDATRVAETAEGRSLSQGEVSTYFYRRAWRWILDQPAQAIKLFARKVAILLNEADVPLNYSYAFYSRDEPSLLRFLVVGPWLLVPLGLIGLLLAAVAARTGGDPEAFNAPRLSYWTWASFVPVYGASVAAFFVSDRYRLPLLVPLTVLSSHTLVWLADMVRRREFAALALPAAGLAISAAVVSWNLGLDDGRGGERARKAVWLIERGSYDDARRYTATAAEGLAYPGVFHFRVGEALTAAGRHEEAVRELRAALAIDRGQPAIQLALGQALLLAGRSADAVPELRAAAAAAYRPEVSGPWLVRALAAAGQDVEAVAALSALSDAVVDAAGPATGIEIGTLALERRAPASAERWLRAAAARAPDSAEAHEKLGVALLLQGRANEALASIERACRLAPASASGRLNLAVVYAQLGRFGEARLAAREAVRLDASEPRAAALLAELSRKPR
jgi:tetratricopeptide (TPR) repeat protein